MHARVRTDQLSRHAQVIAGLAHAALEHIRHVELARDRWHIRRAATE